MSYRKFEFSEIEIMELPLYIHPNHFFTFRNTLGDIRERFRVHSSLYRLFRRIIMYSHTSWYVSIPKPACTPKLCGDGDYQ